MPSYSFSTREKILLGILVVAGLAVAYYQFVFMYFQNQITSLDSQIATAQEELAVYTSRASQLDKMRATVETYQAQGRQPVTPPAFDNTQNLMAYLNGVLAGTTNYSISFDTPSYDESDDSMHRSGSITFGAGSYEQARSVAQAIARGPYPCQIDSIGISGNTSGSGSFSTNMQVTFFERRVDATATSSASSDDNDGPEGQDLTTMINWNEQ